MILCWFFLDLKLSAAMIGFPLLGMFFVFVWHFDEWSIFQNSNIIFHFRNFLAIRVIHFGTSLSKFTNYLCIFLCFFPGRCWESTASQILTVLIQIYGTFIFGQNSEKCVLYSVDFLFLSLYLHSCVSGSD